MADEFNTGINWWDNSTRNTTTNNNRFDHATSAAGNSSAPSSGLNNNSLGSFGWSTTDQMVDIKAAAVAAAAVQGGVPDHHHHPMMGLGLSSQAMDWNQALMHADKSHDQSSFRSMLQQDHHNNYQISSSRSSGFSLDHHHHHQSSSSSSISQFSSCDSTLTCQGLPNSSNFHNMDNSSTAIYGLLGSSDQNQYGAASFGMMNNNNSSSSELLPWSNKVPQFLRSSPPKQHLHGIGGQLHFSNNAPFWNPSSAAPADVRPAPASAAPGFFPPLQTQFPTGNFDQKTKQNISHEAREVKKSGNEAAAKRSRNETTSILPAFKVRKEKMGDRITALQQLVSPFGKTDTASVLSEAIEYIKFLHEQVSVLSTPYMKSGAAIQVQQNSEKSKDPEGPKPDLRSRGLCLVPVSSTFPVTHESPVDFWTPTFGGTYR